MSDRLPLYGQAVVQPDAKAHTTWWSWFSWVDRSVRSLLASQSTATLAPDVGAYTGVSPISVAGTEIRLLAQADTGTGTGLWKFTRSPEGLVSGTDNATTDDLAEGAALYFTDERAQDATAAALAAGTHSGISFVYDDAGNALSLTVTSTVARTITSIASNTTAGVGGDYVYFVSGTTTLTLPTAASNTGLYYAKNVGAGSVTVATTGGQTIDGVATQTLAPSDSMTFCSDGANCEIV